MRIRSLTPDVEKELLEARRRGDPAAERSAREIVEDVRKRGDAALFFWSKKLGDADLHHESVWITKKELRAAERRVSHDFRCAVRKAAGNVRRVAEQQLPKPWTIETEAGVKIRQIVRPIETVACYVPGGHHSLTSTLVMTAVPAAVAGVARTVAVCPKPNDQLLAAAHFLGISEIARIGGAQAVAALAFGTRTIPRVEKICGPGNQYVTAAKQLVSSHCTIDMPAGPTEAIVLAEHGNASWIAADLLAQAEHARDAASLLVTTSRELACAVQREVEFQLSAMPWSTARFSTRNTGAILVARSLDHAVGFVNRFAPEHLSLPSDGRALLSQIQSSGTVFLGPWSAQPLGDYVSGSNHVLPTAGWARSRGGLSSADFVKCFTVQEVSRRGFRRLAPAAELLAESEGLLAHRNAVRIRG